MSYNALTSDLPPAVQMFSDIGLAGGTRLPSSLPSMPTTRWTSRLPLCDLPLSGRFFLCDPTRNADHADIEWVSTSASPMRRSPSS